MKKERRLGKERRNKKGRRKFSRPRCPCSEKRSIQDRRMGKDRRKTV